MIEILTSTPKQLKFNININTIKYDNIKAFIRFKIKDIEYGFEGQIRDNIIYIQIPILNNVINFEKLNNNIITRGRLDIYGNGFYMTPWEDDFNIKQGNIETDEFSAKINSNDFVTVDEIDQFDENVSANIVGFESLPSGGKKETLDGIDYDTNELVKDKDLEEAQKINNIVLMRVKERLRKMELEKKSKPKKKNKKKKRKNIKEDNQPDIKDKKHINKANIITKENILSFMESKGIKNARFQNMILERAEMLSEGTDIQSLFETVKKMLDTTVKLN